MRSLLLFLSICLSLTSLAQSDAWPKFNGDHYQISYPDQWTVDSSGTMGTEVILYSPLENVKDEFKENVNLLMQDLRGRNIDLATYKKITEEQLKEMGGEGKLIMSTIVKDAEGDHYRLEHVMKQGERTLHFVSICTIRMEKAYLLTFTAADDKFNQYKQDGENIMRSFKLKVAASKK